VPWSDISTLDSLRVLRIENCLPVLTGNELSNYLPRYLRQINITGTHGWSMNVQGWITLPNFLQNAPTVESALDGLCQFVDDLVL
jgi:hypothetical protein